MHHHSQATDDAELEDADNGAEEDNHEARKKTKLGSNNFPLEPQDAANFVMKLLLLGNHGEDKDIAIAAYEFLKEFLTSEPSQPTSEQDTSEQDGFDYDWDWEMLTDGIQVRDGVLCPVSVKWRLPTDNSVKWSSVSNKRDSRACKKPQPFWLFMDTDPIIQTSIIRYIWEFFTSPDNRHSMNPIKQGTGSRRTLLPLSTPKSVSEPIQHALPIRQFAGKDHCLQHAYNNVLFSIENFTPFNPQIAFIPAFIPVHKFNELLTTQGRYNLIKIKRVSGNTLFNLMQAPHRYIVVVATHCIAVDLSNTGFIYDSDLAFNHAIPFKFINKDSSASEVSKYYKNKLNMDLPKIINQLWRVNM